jgi:hypothetical protein
MRAPINPNELVAVFRLWEKLNLVKETIIAHCNTIPKCYQSCRTPNTDVVSLFLFDSILDDLKNVKNRKDGRIVSVNTQIHEIHCQLMSLRSLPAEDLKNMRFITFFEIV